MLYTPNDLKFFQHVANLPWKMNPKKHHYFGHFFIWKWACEVQLPSFLWGQKKDYCELKAHTPLVLLKLSQILLAKTSNQTDWDNFSIFQSMGWKFLKFFPHISKSTYYKILQLYVSKNVFFSKSWYLY